MNRVAREGFMEEVTCVIMSVLIASIHWVIQDARFYSELLPVYHLIRHCSHQMRKQRH